MAQAPRSLHLHPRQPDDGHAARQQLPQGVVHAPHPEALGAGAPKQSGGGAAAAYGTMS